jgi:hypothetical protein
MAPAWLFPSMSPKLPVRSRPWLPDISFHLAPLDIVVVYFIRGTQQPGKTCLIYLAYLACLINLIYLSASAAGRRP